MCSIGAGQLKILVAHSSPCGSAHSATKTAKTQEQSNCATLSTFGLLTLQPLPSGKNRVEEHDKAIRKILDANAIDYGVLRTQSVGEPVLCRQYSLAQKDRFNDRIRLEFLQAFNATRKYNKKLPGYYFIMSVVYKNRDILPSDTYPSGIDGSSHDRDGVRYSPVPPVHYMAYDGAENATLIPPSPSSTDLNSPNILEPLSPPESLATPSKPDTNRTPRLSSIPKPERIETKNRDGLYYCTFPGCTERVKTFPRKCEWG